MGTIITAILIIYCIIVFVIMIDKKIDAMPHLQKKEEPEWIKVRREGHKWLNFSSGLSDTPSSELPSRPLKK